MRNFESEDGSGHGGPCPLAAQREAADEALRCARAGGNRGRREDHERGNSGRGGRTGARKTAWDICDAGMYARARTRCLCRAVCAAVPAHPRTASRWGARSGGGAGQRGGDAGRRRAGGAAEPDRHAAFEADDAGGLRAVFDGERHCARRPRHDGDGERGAAGGGGAADPAGRGDRGGRGGILRAGAAVRGGAAVHSRDHARLRRGERAGGHRPDDPGRPGIGHRRTDGDGSRRAADERRNDPGRNDPDTARY